ncbi:sugar-binding domain-containing protein [Formosa undariae]|uniref:Sugar-binding domain-containing protein n=1 Tax=Formosa undariae TaxID=1325436 RepID=A0ABV5F5T8_9FLAO
MKKIYLCAFLFVFCMLNTAYSQSRQLFNADWKFALHEQEGAEAPDFNDKNWSIVNVPHDASIKGEFDKKNSTSGNGYLPFQQGWYRKSFMLSEQDKGKKVFINFEGVYRDSKVWINGELLGRNLNGYLGFEYDLTPYVQVGQENVIVVHYDNRKKRTSRWYTGEGIYRDVWLRIENPVYVANHGTYVTTPFVSKEKAKVTLETEIINEAGKDGEITLETQIYNPSGVVVASKTSVVYLQFFKTHKFHQEFQISNPELWDTETPNLYYAKTKIHFNGEIQGDYNTRFGIRDIEFVPDRGLLLNGNKVFAQGGNFHHDLGCLGAVALKEGYRYRLQQLKDMGSNSIRLSHNPHARVLLELCDEMGILVISESYDKWTSQYYGGEVAFRDVWKTDMERFIKRDRNHPSIYLWSVGNEVSKQRKMFDKKFETEADGAYQGADVLKELVAYVHELDPSRKVTAALFPGRKDDNLEWNNWDNHDEFMKTLPPAMAFNMDVVSWNYTGNFFDIDHEKYPQMLFIASETATNLDFGNRKISMLEFDKSYVVGHYYWAASSYLGESVWPNKSWERSFYGMDEQMTPIGHIYQALYSEDPKLKLLVKEPDTLKYKAWENHYDNKRWSWYPMLNHWNFSADDLLEIQTITNCDEVELLLNGKSLGSKTLAQGEEPVLYWDVNHKEGELIAIGKRNNKIVVRDTLVTASKPALIKLSPNKTELNADGADLVYIQVSLRDKAGHIVPENQLIQFSVNGPASIAGVANSDVFSDESWQGNSRSTTNGTCLVVLRTTTDVGTIELSAKTNGLKSAKLVLDVTKKKSI